VLKIHDFASLLELFIERNSSFSWRIFREEIQGDVLHSLAVPLLIRPFIYRLPPILTQRKRNLKTIDYEEAKSRLIQALSPD
jgi:hypothetical protein